MLRVSILLLTALSAFAQTYTPGRDSTRHAGAPEGEIKKFEWKTGQNRTKPDKSPGKLSSLIG